MSHTTDTETYERAIPDKNIDMYKTELRQKNNNMSYVINRVEAIIHDKENQRNFKLNGK